MHYFFHASLQAMTADMQMDIEFYSPSQSTARQQGQHRRRLREREQRLQQDDDRAADGPTSVQSPLRTPPELISTRQFG